MITKSRILESTDDLEVLLGAMDEACIAVNERLGTLFAYTTVEEKENARYFFWPEQLDDLGWIRLVEDYEIPTQYVEFSVPTREMSDLIEADLAEHLPLLSTAALKAAAREAEDDPAPLARLGVGAEGGHDVEVAELIERGLGHADVAVRTSAAMAAFLLKWPELATAVATALDREEDGDLRAKLAYTLKLCSEGPETSA